jgi:hypothetical protein
MALGNTKKKYSKEPFVFFTNLWLPITNFEYIGGDSIDEDLKCTICFRPFYFPVCNPQCRHTCCEKCVKKWHKNSSACPTCRQRVHLKDYTPVTTRAVLNQLSRLHVKCNLCEQSNIDDRYKHMKIYPKQIIKCTCADIYCLWKGKREDLHIHSEKDSFQKIRPIINQLNYLTFFHWSNILWIFPNQRHYILVYSKTCSMSIWCFSINWNLDCDRDRERGKRHFSLIRLRLF